MKINPKLNKIQNNITISFIILLSIITILYLLISQNNIINIKKNNVNIDKIKGIYMDYQATTPMDPRVISVVNNMNENCFGNPHSKHMFGQQAKDEVEKARTHVANLINANNDEIFFTSGATESNNTVIKGIAQKAKQNGKNHIITMTIEHKCILESCQEVKHDGLEITILNPKSNGIIDLKDLEKAIKKNTALISIMGVNNEIGTIQPIEEIGKIAKKHKILFHTDCAQAFGKIPLDVKKMNIDFMSISSHKIYGPKGVGALFIKKCDQGCIEPLIHGGGQENGMRSGTLPVPIIAGFGEAAKIAKFEMLKDQKNIQKLSEIFIKEIKNIGGVHLNGDKDLRYKGCINLSFEGLNGGDIVKKASDNGLAISTGSACSEKNMKPSYVIDAITKKNTNIKGTESSCPISALGEEASKLSSGAVRFGIGRFTTENEINQSINIIKQIIKELRL